MYPKCNKPHASHRSPATSCAAILATLRRCVVSSPVACHLPSSGAMDAVRFVAVDVEPDACQLSAPLTLSWRFTAAEAIPPGWTWILVYVFDVVHDAREQRLGGCACPPCPPGSTHDTEATCGGIDTTGVPDRCGGVSARRAPPWRLTLAAAHSTTLAC